MSTQVDIDNHLREVTIGEAAGSLSRGSEEQGEQAGDVPVKDCVLAYLEDQTMVPLRRDVPLW